MYMYTGLGLWIDSDHSAAVLILYLFASGDIELNPGPLDAGTKTQ